MTSYLQRRIATEMSALAPIYDELTVWSSRFGLMLLDNLEIRPGIRGLDLGCATGFPLLELAMLHGPSSHFTGIDLWREAIEVARAKVAQHELSNVELQVADAMSLPFEDQSFDLITANLGLNNFEDPVAAMREAARVARPGARIALTTNLTGTMPEVYEVIRSVLKDVAPELVTALEAQEHHRGTLESVKHLVEIGGFRVTRAVTGRFEMKFADGTALLNHGLVAWFLGGWRSIMPQEREEEIFARVEAAMNEQARAGAFVASVATAYLEGETPR